MNRIPVETDDCNEDVISEELSSSIDYDLYQLENEETPGQGTPPPRVSLQAGWGGADNLVIDRTKFQTREENEGAPLPSLFVHNVINTESENGGQTSPKSLEQSEKWQCKSRQSLNDRKRESGWLSPREKKTAESLFLNAGSLLSRGVQNCVFVTITTPQNHSYWQKSGWVEAREKFRSFVGNKSGFESVFGSGCDWIRVIEPQRRGAIHWHMIVHVGRDVRSGVDFESFKRGDYRSAGSDLRNMWARMRRASRAYGLGRSEIMPIRSDRWEASARYVGKYISKGIARESFEAMVDNKSRPLHSRRIGFSSGWKVANCNFSWLEHGQDWRNGVKRLAIVCGAEKWEDLAEILGKKWAFYNRKIIADGLAGMPCIEQENPL